MVGVSDVVDADPDREERCAGRPGDESLVAVDGEELCFDLLLDAENGREVRENQGGVHGRAAVGEVVGLDVGEVVGCGEEVYPIGTVGRSVARVGRVAERVCGVWLRACAGVEASGGVRVAAGMDEYAW